MHRRVLLLEKIPDSTPTTEIDDIADEVSESVENTWVLYNSVHDLCLDSTTRDTFLSKEKQYGHDEYSYLEVHIYD